MGRALKGSAVCSGGTQDTMKSMKARKAVKSMKVVKPPSAESSSLAAKATGSTHTSATNKAAEVIKEEEQATKSTITVMNEQGYWELHPSDGHFDKDMENPMMGKLVVFNCPKVAKHYLGGIVIVHQYRGTSSEHEAVYEVRYGDNERISLDRHEFWVVRSLDRH
jgi:hypothetical protein